MTIDDNDYTPILCFFGDFNQVFDALTDEDYNSYPHTELTFNNITKTVAKFDERIGKIIGFYESEIHFLDGKVIKGTSIKNQEEFRLVTNGKRFLPNNRVKGYCLKITTNTTKDIEEFYRIEKLLLNQKYDEAKGYTKPFSSYIWEEI